MEGGLHFIRFSTPHCTGIEKTVTTWHLQRVRGGVVLFNFSTNGILRHCWCANFFGTYFFLAYDTIGDSNFYASNRGVLRSIHHHFHYVLSRVFSVLQISLRTIAWLFLTTGYRVVFSVHYHHVLSRRFPPCIFSLHVPPRHFPSLISSLPPGPSGHSALTIRTNEWTL